MGKADFTEEFRIDAIKQTTERGYSVRDVSQRLGVSTHSLYGWMKRYSTSSVEAAKQDQSAEIRRLKQKLVRVTEERDILKKKPPRTSPRMQNEVRVYQDASCSHHVPEASIRGCSSCNAAKRPSSCLRYSNAIFGCRSIGGALRRFQEFV